jgi:uncharacterized protein (TIGR02284 family)
MATTIGTESNVHDLLSDLVQLDYDAVNAYQAAIDRLDNQSFRTALAEFKGDHERHIEDLSAILREMAVTPPERGSAKTLLTKGKVMIGALMGDKAILSAMRTNEADTNTAYERAVDHPDVAPATRTVLERNLADERRHCDWILATLERLD